MLASLPASASLAYFGARSSARTALVLDVTTRSVSDSLAGVKGVPGTLQEGGVAFASTHWTMVSLAAGSQSPEETQAALDAFCQAYWPPLYTFLRRRGYPPNDAQDLTQGFFANLLQQNVLSRVDRDKGRLRTFLLGSLQHYMANEYDRTRTLKRGGGHQIVSMSEHLAETEAALAVTHHLGVTGSYDQAWAAALVTRSWENLQEALATEGQTRWLEELKPFLIGGETVPPRPQEVATRLNVSIDTLRSALRRLRERYRELIRLEVARTVADPAEIDEELNDLYRLLLA